MAGEAAPAAKIKASAVDRMFIASSFSVIA
jgi:hypothetical protein